METKEYIVILNTGFNYNEVWADIESPSNGLPHIPDRPVSILNNHDAFDRMCAYALTDEEAELLKQDPRVAGVELPIEKMPGVEIGPYITQNLTPAPATITRSVNWSQANGDFTLFVEGNNFTGWIGDITKANFLIDSNERSNIVNNTTIRSELKKIGSILNTTVSDSTVTSTLNSVVDSLNNEINLFIKENTQAVCVAGQPAIYTSATSFVYNGKRYTRTTLRTSQINYGFNSIINTLPTTDVIAEQAIGLLVSNGLILNTNQRSVLKSALIVVFELVLDIVRSISDNVDLYDYTVQMETVTGNFNKTTSSSGPNINWGLIRHTNTSNIYGVQGTTSLNYNYELDGTGVDVVISDSGIQADHPEFTDSTGVSRVQQINWASYVPALSTMGSPYQDLDGHGTHVAGTAAGKTYGWAKNSRIYSILAFGAGAPSTLNQFAAIKLWHLSKNGSRPTVVNMSWGSRYLWYELGGLPSTTQGTKANIVSAMNNFLNSISGGSYRGETYLGGSSLIGPSTNVAPKGLLISSSISGFVNSFFAGIPAQSLQVTVALEELIGAGVVVVHAAGNSSYKIDKPIAKGGTGDYDNYITYNNNNRIYYNRGSSPQSDLSICVGNMDSSTLLNGQEKKADSSCAGPGVDIYAAGTNIMSSTTSDKNATKYSSSNPYSLNADFRQLNISGTSMASPQVAGMCALYLQRYPAATPAEVKKWIVDSATSNIYTGSALDYSFQSLLGGQPKVAYQNLQAAPTNKSYIKDNTNTWQEARAVYVKHDDGTWKQARSGWQKNNAGAWVKIYQL